MFFVGLRPQLRLDVVTSQFESDSKVLTNSRASNEVVTPSIAISHNGRVKFGMVSEEVACSFTNAR